MNELEAFLLREETRNNINSLNKREKGVKLANQAYNDVDDKTVLASSRNYIKEILDMRKLPYPYKSIRIISYLTFIMGLVMFFIDKVKPISGNPLIYFGNIGGMILLISFIEQYLNYKNKSLFYDKLV